MSKKINVIKFGGSLAQDKRISSRFFDDMADISKKQHIVLVHGGGPEVSAWIKKLGLTPTFIQGLRYTDLNTLEIVEMVLSGKVNKHIVCELHKRGVKGVGISAKDGHISISKRIAKLGFVGEPQKIDPTLVVTLMQSGFLPVISSLSMDAKGQTLNVNADSVAMGLAAALKADKLILLTDVNGVLDENKKTIKTIRVHEIGELIADGVITGGMIPKIQACKHSIQSGLKEVWVAYGKAGIKNIQGTRIIK